MSDIISSPVTIWAIIGIVLIIIELMSVTFVFAFFGVGALIVSVAAWLGLTPGLDSQLVLFAVSSVLLMLAFRKTAKKLFFGHHDVAPTYKGEKVQVVKSIPAGGEGSISYRGSVWIAFSESADTIPEGSTVEIILLDGIRARVVPVKPTPSEKELL